MESLPDALNCYLILLIEDSSLRAPLMNVLLHRFFSMRLGIQHWGSDGTAELLDPFIVLDGRARDSTRMGLTTKKHGRSRCDRRWYNIDAMDDLSNQGTRRR